MFQIKFTTTRGIFSYQSWSIVLPNFAKAWATSFRESLRRKKFDNKFDTCYWSKLFVISKKMVSIVDLGEKKNYQLNWYEIYYLFFFFLVRSITQLIWLTSNFLNTCYLPKHVLLVIILLINSATGIIVSQQFYNKAYMISCH